MNQPLPIAQPPAPAPPVPWALSINDAARMVGLSKQQFRRLYIDSGRLRVIETGKRDRVIDTAELRSAYQRLVREQRATKEPAK